MNNKRNNEIEQIKIWNNSNKKHFVTGMGNHSQFISTRPHRNSDLGGCVIATFAPHIVCKYYAFQTNVGKTDNPRKLHYRQVQYEHLQDYIEMRTRAFEIANEAEKAGLTPREYLKKKGLPYDEVFDEARPVIKVPGFNVFLELRGCLDSDVSPEQLEWDGPHGIAATMEMMAQWAVQMFDAKDAYTMRTNRIDELPIRRWQFDFDLSLFFSDVVGCGLGFGETDIDRRMTQKYAYFDHSKFYYGRGRNNVKSEENENSENAK